MSERAKPLSPNTRDKWARGLWLVLAAVVFAFALEWTVIFRGLEAVLGIAVPRLYGSLPENEFGQKCREELKAKKIREAEDHCRKALEIDPRHACRATLAEIEFRLDRLEQAKIEISRHLQTYPLDGPAILLRAEISAKLGLPRDQIRSELEKSRHLLISRRSEFEKLKGTSDENSSAKHRWRLAVLAQEISDLTAKINELCEIR
ncbi:MAG: hypothetical protein HY791_09735 [Deltaproteobacteria bacterium]|nr:hypothetical protein [Deltaproteobacteria bacterium]